MLPLNVCCLERRSTKSENTRLTVNKRCFTETEYQNRVPCSCKKCLQGSEKFIKKAKPQLPDTWSYVIVLHIEDELAPPFRVHYNLFPSNQDITIVDLVDFFCQIKQFHKILSEFNAKIGKEEHFKKKRCKEELIAHDNTSENVRRLYNFVG